MSAKARRLLRALVLLAVLLSAERAHAQNARPVRFIWDSVKTSLFVSVSYRDVIDADTRQKLVRGLPVSIAMTAAIYESGNKDPVATTAQTCKITWLVWDEVYLVEITRPSGTVHSVAGTVEGVLRRCAQTQNLIAATSNQVTVGAPVYMIAKVQVNPLSPETLDKIRRWVSRPSGTGTAAPGDALFSTFTGLFLQRIGDAESELKFTTRTVVPSVAKPKKKP